MNARALNLLASQGDECDSLARSNMPATGPETPLYKRANFSTRLPTDYLYSPSHCWLAKESGVWRVGFTKFATRMLGEPVDHGFNAKPDSRVEMGQVIGWIEGFKAISDIYCVVDGEFRGGNPGLAAGLEAIDRDCYGGGWLYAAAGSPGSLCMDVASYRSLLDKTIDKILEQQKE